MRSYSVKENLICSVVSEILRYKQTDIMLILLQPFPGYAYLLEESLKGFIFFKSLKIIYIHFKV